MWEIRRIEQSAKNLSLKIFLKWIIYIECSRNFHFDYKLPKIFHTPTHYTPLSRCELKMAVPLEIPFTKWKIFVLLSPQKDWNTQYWAKFTKIITARKSAQNEIPSYRKPPKKVGLILWSITKSNTCCLCMSLDSILK